METPRSHQYHHKLVAHLLATSSPVSTTHTINTCNQYRQHYSHPSTSYTHKNPNQFHVTLNPQPYTTSLHKNHKSLHQQAILSPSGSKNMSQKRLLSLPFGHSPLPPYTQHAPLTTRSGRNRIHHWHHTRSTHFTLPLSQSSTS